MRKIFNCNNKHDAEEQLKETVSADTLSHPKLMGWLELNAEESMSYYDWPRSIHNKIRTTNPLERLNREIKRRTKVVSIFPDESSCLRLITALLVEVDDSWKSRKYVRPEFLIK